MSTVDKWDVIVGRISFSIEWSTKSQHLPFKIRSYQLLLWNRKGSEATENFNQFGYSKTHQNFTNFIFFISKNKKVIGVIRYILTLLISWTPYNDMILIIPGPYCAATLQQRRHALDKPRLIGKWQKASHLKASKTAKNDRKWQKATKNDGGMWLIQSVSTMLSASRLKTDWAR